MESLNRNGSEEPGIRKKSKETTSIGETVLGKTNDRIKIKQAYKGLNTLKMPQEITLKYKKIIQNLIFCNKVFQFLEHKE